MWSCMPCGCDGHHVALNIRSVMISYGMLSILLYQWYGNHFHVMMSSKNCWTWWRHQIETFSASLAIGVENWPVTGDADQWRGPLMFPLICTWINIFASLLREVYGLDSDVNSTFIEHDDAMEWNSFRPYLFLAGNPSVTGGFSIKQPVMRSSDIFFEVSMDNLSSL